MFMWEEVIAAWQEKLSFLNKQILEKYEGKDNFSALQVRDLLKKELNADFWILQQMSQGEIEDFLQGRSLIGIDGSMNTVGTTFPHYLTLFQALAKSTSKEEIVEQDFHTPLLREERARMVAQAMEEEMPLGFIQDQIKSLRLAQLELKVAHQALQSMECSLLVFDGPLWRYEKKAPELWEEFCNLAQEKEVCPVGVIEEVSSAYLAPLLGERLPGSMQDFYDRDLLFGLLKQGEIFLLPQELKEGYLTCYLRPSSDPQVIAFDFPAAQKGRLKLISNLLYTLTPKEGRGIPIWLDIVDNQVRITHQLMDGLLKSNLAPELLNKLLLAQRKKRMY